MATRKRDTELQINATESIGKKKRYDTNAFLASFYFFFLALVRVGKVLRPHRQVPVLQECFLPVVSVFGIRRIYTQSLGGLEKE